jgi:NhaP-type Na+/H+ or K+/H+ antiporter
MVGTDDVLACFIAGNVFTWDDWFRLETMDDSLQPTIDMLLNVAIFMWYGAVCPWHSFLDNNVINIGRLIALGVLVLLLRRLPMVLAFHKHINQIDDLKRAGFMGFFGPIGVSAVFYLYVSRQFLREIEVDGVQREDAAQLEEVMEVVIWFLIICSIVTHGLSIPVGKLGFHLPRTISTALSQERTSRPLSRASTRAPQDGPERSNTHRAEGARSLEREFRRRRPTSSELGPREVVAQKTGLAWVTSVFGHLKWASRVNRDDTETSDAAMRASNNNAPPVISAPRDARRIGNVITQPITQVEARNESSDEIGSQKSEDDEVEVPTAGPSSPGPTWNRSIRFGDEAKPRA